MIAILKLVFWFTGTGLETVVGGLMLRRKLYREYPFFFAYILSQLARFVILFTIYQSGDRAAYRQAYVWVEIVDGVLSFAAIYELFAFTFRAYEGIRELGWMMLRGTVVVLILLAVVSAAAAPGSEADRFRAALYVMERSVNVVRGGLLLFLFLLHGSLGLRWERYCFGIALGFGMIASVELVTYALGTQFGVVSASVLSLLASASYSCAAGVWIKALLWAAERPPEMHPPREDLDGWNRSLLELMQR